MTALDEPGPGSGAGAPHVLALALLASLLLHLAVLRALSAERASTAPEPPPAALRVRIVTPARAAPAPRQALQRAAQPRPRPAAPRPAARRTMASRRPNPDANLAPARPPMPRLAPHRRVAPPKREHRSSALRRAARPRVVTSHVLAASAAMALAGARPLAPAPVPARAEPSIRSGSQQARHAKPAAAAPHADERLALARYRRSLMAQAQRYGRYPLTARDNDWQGTVELRMVIGADGALASIGVRRGTGYAILDHEALRMMRRAEPLAPIPHALRGRQFSVEIPVIFKLREPG